ncbi:MAG: YqgE/AlgH family protein [Myxococcota bacterium]
MQPSLLIASPQMRDPFFERAVVLVWHHDEDGALGVVVNRYLKQRLPDVLEVGESIELEAYGDVPVAWGGPVESRSGTVVTSGRLMGDEGVALPSGLAVTHSQDALLRLLAERAPLMLCLGYAGWGAGQLDKEIEAGGWLWTDCDAHIVFDTPPEERYDKALASLGLTAGLVWMQPVSE